jgi:glycosyltransferase involved in cell wall biosynthesis
MRILLVNDYATATGGAEVQMLMLRSALRERGHDARLFASSAGDPPDGAADDLCFGTTSALRTPLQLANPSARTRLRRVIAEFRPDVVHVRLFLTQLSPLIMPLVRDLPSLLHVAWYRPICPRGTKMLPDGRHCAHRAGVACRREGCLSLRAWTPAMLQLALMRRHLPAFTRIVTLSEPIRRRLVAEGIPVSEVLRNGVQDRAGRPALAGPPTVSFAGRLVPEKGADLLIRAFAALREAVPDACLLIAGEGPERSRLEALARDLGVAAAIEFTGHLARATVEDRLSAAWVQAMPGRWIEPFGNAGAEALMRGTSLVASEPGGAADLVRDSCGGVTVPRADVTALARALAERLADRSLCEAEGRRGRAWAMEHLRLDDYVHRVEGVYRDLIEAAA